MIEVFLPSSVDVTRLVDPFKSEPPDETFPFNAVSELSATPDVFMKRDRAEPTIEDVLDAKSLSCVLALADILLSTSAFTAANAAEVVGIKLTLVESVVLVTAVPVFPTVSIKVMLNVTAPKVSLALAV